MCSQRKLRSKILRDKIECMVRRDSDATTCRAHREGGSRQGKAIGLLDREAGDRTVAAAQNFVDRGAAGSHLRTMLQAELRPQKQAHFDDRKENKKEHRCRNAELDSCCAAFVPADAIQYHGRVTVDWAVSLKLFGNSG
jgi:hypothetical protein